MIVFMRKAAVMSLGEFIEMLADQIQPEDIEKFLPFGVIRRDSAGDGEYQHLLLNSVIPVVTLNRIVLDGEPLCQRWDKDYVAPTGKKELCPGCFNIGKSVAMAGR